MRHFSRARGSLNTSCPPQLAGVQPVIKLEAPVACFDGGKRGTPRPTSHAHKPDEYTEVREAWRRIITSKPAVDSNRKKSSSLREGSQLAKDISRNKKMAYKQQQIDQLHASELQHLQRRIQHNHTSITERKKNKLDASLCACRNQPYAFCNRSSRAHGWYVSLYRSGPPHEDLAKRSASKTGQRSCSACCR